MYAGCGKITHNLAAFRVGGEKNHAPSSAGGAGWNFVEGGRRGWVEDWGELRRKVKFCCRLFVPEQIMFTFASPTRRRHHMGVGEKAIVVMIAGREVPFMEKAFI